MIRGGVCPQLCNLFFDIINTILGGENGRRKKNHFNDAVNSSAD